MVAGTSLRGNRQTVRHGTICRLRRGPEKQRHRLWIDPTPFRPLLTPANSSRSSPCEGTHAIRILGDPVQSRGREQFGKCIKENSARGLGWHIL